MDYLLYRILIIKVAILKESNDCGKIKKYEKPSIKEKFSCGSHLKMNKVEN
jgi:hypothetical protein